jgi:lipopolysaccharide/colanic/teichoic acid biosynthesis glycosyltransferase
MKRLFDITVASLGLLLLLPLFLILAILIKLDTPGPVIFRQERIGREFRSFFIYKLRTMIENAPSLRQPITIGDDARITRVGRVLRKFKLDELPQLMNVIKGDMALVGPRPEVRFYVEMFRRDYEEILKVKPGITDLASIKYSDEAAWLARFPDPERAYATRLLPDKIDLAKEYVRRSSLRLDLRLILKTVEKLFLSKVNSGSCQRESYDND